MYLSTTFLENELSVSCSLSQDSHELQDEQCMRIAINNIIAIGFRNNVRQTSHFLFKQFDYQIGF